MSSKKKTMFNITENNNNKNLLSMEYFKELAFIFCNLFIRLNSNNFESIPLERLHDLKNKSSNFLIKAYALK